jgi:hypothetical protein
MMDVTTFYQNGSHLLLGAFATFCAILLWSRTRDIAWTFVIIGVIVGYANIVYTTLIGLHILGNDILGLALPPNVLSVVSIALADLPLLFSGIGFLIAATRRRQP